MQASNFVSERMAARAEEARKQRELDQAVHKAKKTQQTDYAKMIIALKQAVKDEVVESEDDAEGFLQHAFGGRVEQVAANKGMDAGELVESLWEQVGGSGGGRRSKARRSRKARGSRKARRSRARRSKAHKSKARRSKARRSRARGSKARRSKARRSRRRR